MTYRNLISSKDADIFRETLQNLSHEIDPSKIGYLGLIGSSVNYGVPTHDLDVLVLPALNAKPGEAMVEMNQLYSSLDEKLQKENGLYLSPCPRKIMQAEVNYIIGENLGHQGKLSVHTLFFPDFKSFKSINPVGFIDSISNNHEDLVGNLDDFNNHDSYKQKDLDVYFLISDYQLSLVAEKYPKLLTLEKNEELSDYLEKRYSLNLPTENCVKSIKKNMDNLLLSLDDLVA